MKILFLSQKLDAMRPSVERLRKLGASVLLVEQDEDAYLCLKMHGRSIDLALIHVVGPAKERLQGGLNFIGKFKSDLIQADLPYILLTDKWDDQDCVQHQKSKLGANAYLPSPIEPDALVKLIEKVTGWAGEAVTEPEDLIQALDSPRKPPQPPVKKVEHEEPGSEFDENEQSVALDMPYLFSDSVLNYIKEKGESLRKTAIGEAVIPGGVSGSPDEATLLKYLELREQDVAVLSNHLKEARELIEQLQKESRLEKARVGELEHTVRSHEKTIEDYEIEKRAEIDSLEREVVELREIVKEKDLKKKILEEKLKSKVTEQDRLKERVRSDLRKIRNRERELENRLEILRKDSEALLSSRESKIIELKRKLDLAEFNMDLMQDKFSKEKERVKELKGKLIRAAQAMKVAGGFLGSDVPIDLSDLQDKEQEDERGEKVS